MNRFAVSRKRRSISFRKTIEVFHASLMQFFAKIGLYYVFLRNVPYLIVTKMIVVSQLISAENFTALIVKVAMSG